MGFIILLKDKGILDIIKREPTQQSPNFLVSSHPLKVYT